MKNKSFSANPEAAPRANRRAQQQRVKARALKIMRLWTGPNRSITDPRKIGVNVSTHCRPCACYGCTGPRREIPQPRERAFYYSEFF